MNETTNMNKSKIIFPLWIVSVATHLVYCFIAPKSGFLDGIIIPLLPIVALSAFFITYIDSLPIAKKLEKAKPVLFAVTIFAQAIIILLLKVLGGRVLPIPVAMAFGTQWTLLEGISAILFIIAGILYIKGKRFNLLIYIAVAVYVLIESATIFNTIRWGETEAAAQRCVGYIINFIPNLAFFATLVAYCIFNKAPTAGDGTLSPTEKLAKAKERLDSGDITEEEYNTYKEKIIKSMQK